MSETVPCPRNRCGVSYHRTGSQAHRLCGAHDFAAGSSSSLACVRSGAGADADLIELESIAQQHLGHTRLQIRAGADAAGLDPEDLEETVLELERSFAQHWGDELRTEQGHCFAPEGRIRRKLGRKSLLDVECAQLSAQWGQLLSTDERSTLRIYIAMAYQRINRQLRTDPAVLPDTKGTRETAQDIADLDAALAKAQRPDEPMTLYRGYFVPVGQNARQWAAGLVGTQLDFSTYLSTSWDPAVAEGFVSDDPDRAVLFEISTSAGVPLSAVISEDNTEREWLLPRDMTFEVVAVHSGVSYQTLDMRGQAKHTVVQLREVDPADDASTSQR